MERLRQAMNRAEQALGALDEVLRIEDASEIERDAAIQRTEFAKIEFQILLTKWVGIWDYPRKYGFQSKNFIE